MTTIMHCSRTGRDRTKLARLHKMQKNVSPDKRPSLGRGFRVFLEPASGTCMMAVRKDCGLKKPESHTEAGRLKSEVHDSSSLIRSIRSAYQLRKKVMNNVKGLFTRNIIFFSEGVVHRVARFFLVCTWHQS
jgi:hypothetical protein